MAATQANKWLSPAKLWCPNLVGLPSLTLWWPSMAWQWKPMSPHEIPWIPYLLIVNMVNLHFHPFLTVDGTTFQPSRLEEADKTQGVDQLLVTWWQPYRDGGTKNAFNRIYSTSTLWLFNIAMENGLFIDDLPIKTSIYKGFSMAMLNNQMVCMKITPKKRIPTCISRMVLMMIF